jgi:uncharacterized Fe-S cluster-containing protein
MEERAVGQTVDSYCGKCRHEHPHTIVVMDEDTVAKVRCTNCASVHKPRVAPEPGKGPKAKTKVRSLDGPAAQAIWEKCVAEATGKECSYSMTDKYRVGDIVNHQVFGKGVVLKLYPTRCEMIFKDRSRLMVSANR